VRAGERLFVMWSGLKGAVPVLLGTYILTAQVSGAARMYDVVVVVVAFSVVVQGSLVPYIAHRTGVPMRTVEPEPWALGVRFRHEPAGMRRYLVAAGAPADGSTLADLALGEDAWISFISRDGALVPVRRDTVLRAGDEVVVLAGPTAQPDPEPLFTSTTRAERGRQDQTAAPGSRG
jgi:cell volume regulation protein A